MRFDGVLDDCQAQAGAAACAGAVRLVEALKDARHIGGIYPDARVLDADGQPLAAGARG